MKAPPTIEEALALVLQAQRELRSAVDRLDSRLDALALRVSDLTLAITARQDQLLMGRHNDAG